MTLLYCCKRSHASKLTDKHIARGKRGGVCVCVVGGEGGGGEGRGRRRCLFRVRVYVFIVLNDRCVNAYRSSGLSDWVVSQSPGRHLTAYALISQAATGCCFLFQV
jgi:hypothetical protein